MTNISNEMMRTEVIGLRETLSHLDWILLFFLWSFGRRGFFPAFYIYYSMKMIFPSVAILFLCWYSPSSEEPPKQMLARPFFSKLERNLGKHRLPPPLKRTKSASALLSLANHNMLCSLVFIQFSKESSNN